MTIRRLRRLAALCTTTWLLASCGGATPGTNPPQAGPPAATTTSASPPAPAGTDIPAVDVTDLSSGGRVNLASIAPSERPTLVWFWAPT